MRPGVCLKSHLVRVYWIKVDGEYIYQDERKESDSAENSDDVDGIDGSEDFWL